MLGTEKSDIHEYHIDTFAIGDDWMGKLGFLKGEGGEAVYLLHIHLKSAQRKLSRI